MNQFQDLLFPIFLDVVFTEEQSVELAQAYLFEGIEDFLSLTEMSEQKF